MSDIAYQNKDITLKLAGDALIGKSLAPLGLPHIQIRETRPTNLPAVEANELRLDHLFVLSDGSIAIIDYESTFDKRSVVKYMNYLARVLNKYIRKSFRKTPQFHLIIIYAADVRKASTIVYDFGCVRLSIEAAYLTDLDSGKIIRQIQRRIGLSEMLTDEEMIQLIVLSLTVKGNAAKRKMAQEAVCLAKMLEDEGQRNQALAGILTFADKILDEEFAEKIKEEITMLKVDRLIYNEGYENGEKKGESRGEKRGLITAYREFGISREDSIARIMQKFNLSKEDAAAFVNEFWNPKPVQN